MTKGAGRMEVVGRDEDVAFHRYRMEEGAFHRVAFHEVVFQNQD